MQDRFMFSDGQDLTTLNSTGARSEHQFDLEVGVVADQMQMGWINFIILLSDNDGAAEGLDLELRSSDNVNLSTTPIYLGGIHLLQAEIATGGKYSFGFCRANLKAHLGMWYKATNNSLTNNTTVDCWFSEQPISVTGIQKKPA